MQKRYNYLIGYGAGFVISVILGVVAGLLTDLTALNVTVAFIYVFWGITAVSLLTAFVLSMFNTYNFDRSLDCQLNNHILLLTVSSVLVTVFTSVLGLLISTEAITVLLLKVFTGLSVFSFGMLITAVLSFIYWLIRTTVNTNEG